MTVLGEAFIAVKADLRPFTRDLDHELKTVVEKFEKRLSKTISKALHISGDKDLDALGQQLGDKLGRGLSDGINNRLGRKKKAPWLAIPAALAAALDDGISALPTEVKAGIVGGILAAAPLASAALSGLVAASIGAGFAILGTVLAFQFDDVQRRGLEFVENMRTRLVRAAEPFANAVIGSLDLIEQRFDERLTPLLEHIFAFSSTFLDDLTSGLLNALENILTAIDSNIEEIGPFVEELAVAFGVLGTAVAKTFDILINTGEAGQEGLRDLIFFTAQLLIATAQLVSVMAQLYGTLRNMAEDPVIQFFMGFTFPLFVAKSNEAAEASSNLAQATGATDISFRRLITSTKAEEKELKEYLTLLDKARDASFEIVDANIDFEESLDRLAESIKQNGKTLDVETEEGRENLRTLGQAIKTAQENAENRYRSGQLSSEQALAFYNKEIERIIAIGKQLGITEQAIRGVYNAQLNLVNLPGADPTPLQRLADAGAAAAAALARAANEAARLRGALPRQGTRGFSEFGDGGMVYSPTAAVVGEAGAEVIIPLTKPARAAELMRQSGLDRMLSGAGTVVQVFIGNEQLDSRMVRIVESNNMLQTRTLAYGPR